jgi:hypothetical protein
VNDAEARDVLAKELTGLRAQSFADLTLLIDRPTTREVRGASGAVYQVELQAFWDARPGENLRVLGSVDDGGMRALLPLTDAFIIAPDGRMVGE